MPSETPSQTPTELPLGVDPRPRHLTAADIARLEARYGTGRRQLFRWRKEGAPIHDPALMPAWWQAERDAGRKSHQIPDKILRAAQASAPASSPEPARGVEPPAPASPHITTERRGQAINLEDFDPEEGDELREMKQRRAAWSQQFREKLSQGFYDDILENKINKLAGLISQLQSRIEARLIKAGRYVLLDHVQGDIARAAEAIRQMGASESRRLLELCPAVPAEHHPSLRAAVAQLAEARARVFRNFKNLRTPEDAALELAAA